MNKFAWVLVVCGLFAMISPLGLFEGLGHYTGLMALVSLFIGISLLKKRKDQLARKNRASD